MPKIFVYVSEYEGIFEHKGIEAGEPTQGCMVVEVSDKELKELDKLQEASEAYSTQIGGLYETAVETERKRLEEAKCKFRIRPGKWCGAQTKPGTDRCAEHLGKKNLSDKMEEADDNA